MSQISVFELTQKIIEESEAYILDHKWRNRIGLWVFRHIIFPIKFLFKGFKDVFKPFLRFVIISFLFFMSGVFVSDYIQVSDEATSLILSFCLFLSMALVIFSVPSTYAYYGVENINVNAIVEYLESININKIETIECVQENLDQIFQRIECRISAYKWIVAASWALFVFILNQETSFALKISPESLEKTMEDNIGYLAVFVGISLLAISIISSYKRASELLVKTIGFGLVELKHKLLLESHD